MLNLYPTTLLILGGVLHSTTSLPLYHRATARQLHTTDMQTATSGAYQHVLESNGIAATTFHPIPVQHLASSPGNQLAINQAIFSAVDRIPPSNFSFSDQYQKFLVDSGALWNSSTMQVETGTSVPSYSLPSLDTTLSKWQSQTTKADWPTKISATTITISFGGIQLLDVQRGGWFDDFQNIKGIQAEDQRAERLNPGSIVMPSKIIPKYFGTAESPGPAATYVDKVLVVYKPSANISDSNSASPLSNAEQANGGLWGPDISEPSETQDGLVFSPKTEDAYIVGVVTRSYWDAA